ncbi:MAG: serine hydrolase domain-containing protein [Mycobacterium sp.]
MPRMPVLLAVALLVGACSGRGPAASTVGPEPGDRTARSQALLDGAINAEDPGCSAAVGVEGTVVWTGVRGLADLATGAAITADTVFDIASVSKQFTATAVLLLVQEGKLALDDPLSGHLPGLPRWADSVTVAQLIHQTSGIPDYIGLLDDAGVEENGRATQADALTVLGAVPELDFEPGAQFEYSNSNYILLAEIVSEASGQPLPKYLSVNIFQPLDLVMVLDPAGTTSNEAVPYAQDGGGYLVADSSWEQIGDGAIQTTPSQLVRWADNYRTGRVGGRALLAAQLAGAVPDGAERYGAGISLLPDGSIGHEGAWGGFVSDFRVSSDRRTSLAISCNIDDQDTGVLVSALAQLWI